MSLKQHFSPKRAGTTKGNADFADKVRQISLETFFTSPDFFGVTSAVAVQRAKCRIVTGLPVGDLASDPSVLEMCGGTIPDFEGSPREVLDISAIRIGKSLFAACLIFWLTQNVDLSGTRASDIVRLFVVALKIGGTDAVLKHLLEPMLSKPAFRKFLVDDPKDITLGTIKTSGLKIRQLSTGRVVEVMPIPLDRAGGSAVSVYCAGVVVDEYPRMIGAEDGVRNVEHFHEAVLGRLLPGAVFLATGSPWQPYGPAYDNTAKFFGKPSEDLVVLRTSAKPFVGVAPAWTKSGKQKHPPHEQLQRRSPLAYKTDFLAEFADGEEAVFPGEAIEDAWRPVTPVPAIYGRPAIFADPSALRHDYWAAMVGGWAEPVTGPEDLYETEFLGDSVTPGRGQVIPGRGGWIRILEDDLGNPLPRKDGLVRRPWFEVFEVVSWDKKSGARGLDLVKSVGQLGRKYGCSDFHWDGYEQLMLGDLVRQEGFRPVVHTWSGQGRKTDAVDHLRTLFIERRVRLPQHALLKQELQRFRARATPGGNFQYIVAGGAGHGDHASCLTLAMRADLDGFVDRSPTKLLSRRHEVLDYEDHEEEDSDY
jgi:hypothetical protein